MDAQLNKAASAYSSIANLQLGKQPNPLAGAAETTGQPEFTELVGEALNKAIAVQYKSESVSAKSLVGKTELVDLISAVGNAERTLNTVVAVRDKVISAYTDIIKMPI